MTKSKSVIVLLMTFVFAVFSLSISFVVSKSEEKTSARSSTEHGSGAKNLYIEDGKLPSYDNPGKSLYEQSCSTCHGLNGQGTQDAPSLTNSGAAKTDFYIATGRMPLDSPMPQANRGNVRLSDVQRRAVVNYVASFGNGPDIPVVDTNNPDLVLGAKLYANNCASCHNSQGSGGALLHGASAPSLYPTEPLQIAEAIRTGPGAMPPFGEKTLNQEELNSLVAYVEFLKDGPNSGGVPSGGLGPVGEGFIAWIVGLGALLAITRWIGTRV